MTAKSSLRRWAAPAALAALVLVALGLALRIKGAGALDYLVEQEAWLRMQYAAHPAAFVAAAFAVYAVGIAVPFPLAAALSLGYGWFFGFVTGTILVSFASTAGALLAFLASRYLFRASIERQFADRLAGFRETLERDGAYYLFSLRMLVAVPPFVINVVAGLTKMRAWTFWWVSQLGMFPGTCLYLYAGANLPSARVLADRGVRGIVSPAMVVALALLGCFPIVAKKVLPILAKKVRRPRSPSP